MSSLIKPSTSAASTDHVEVEDDGYGEVFARHRVTVFRFAALLCGNDDVAEEITAEVFARVLPKWRRQLVLEPLPYLRRAVLNEVRSRWRRLGHERRAAVRARLDTQLKSDTHSVELREPLLRALKRLPLRQRTVVVLRYVEDMSEADVGSCLGMASGTVKSQSSRGLATLRTLMMEEGK